MDSQRRAAPGHLAPPAPPAALESDDPLDAALRADPAARDKPPEAAPGETSPRRHSLRPADEGKREDFLTSLAFETWNFDFFSTVRRLDALSPDLQGIGLSDRVDGDPIRFCQQPLLVFPPSSLSRYDPPTGNSPGRLFVAFIGMLGPHGPLPLHLTEYAHDRELHAKDRTFSRFLDVFNHRLVSLFYRAWSVNQMPASYDRSMAAAGINPNEVSPEQRAPALLEDDDPYAVYIGALFGLGMESVRLRDRLPDTAKLHYAGRLAAIAPGPEGLRSVMQDYFGVPVSLEEFAGHWLSLPPSALCRLGGDPVDRGPASLGGPLGGAVAGARVWDCQGKFRLRFGPMSLKDYQRFLPNERAAKRIEAWIRNFVGDEFAWEAQIILNKDEVPKARLGAGGSALGWTSWNYSGKAQEDRGDLTIRSRH